VLFRHRTKTHKNETYGNEAYGNQAYGNQDKKGRSNERPYFYLNFKN